ncbi:BTB/POZ domain-containing protein 6-A-like isoform X1 [Penaeus chinensis]|uniref:BTB/POZ domain-containing protein 6-A-like isoform X1 n=1 Tax=Penaeus chinensis TaxID=139456 RepID=UPI001FB757CC|nr:BTB/POZ domain-containing protein 6-A-like isoform X1 [Penaeus chinensis]XP_047487896.1 BTB/POZ domain-containing protein 6-A-like isoform X1 [Penaeus chinensis]XP_047487897.1 BTB/POZ domain-containing protein 6-A-like isoform X1 [Penaeus chinensis]XP_047487898.1 BTB/POZ domain-containing protein 6-A-like isoform X1 [Penaeus chinensis]
MRNFVYYTVMGPCKWVQLSLHLIRGRSYNLFENEDGSDVILMVGDEGYRERVPAHSWVLSAENPYFRAMFQGPLADRHKKTYDIPNDPKGFQNLLKWLYRHECGIQSIDSALITLQVAIQYLCPELAELCVEYIGKHLTVGNVLKVLQYTWRYCPSQQCSDQSQANLDPSTAPSAPSLEALEGTSKPETNSYGASDPKPHQPSSQHTIHSMSQLQDIMDDSEFQDPTACCSDLFNVCLDVVDRGTQSVLSTEFLEELDSTTFQLILKRSTLNVPNELKVFQALQRWSTAECKRRMLPLTPDNRRAVLGNLLYHVRFLCMNNEQLQQTTSLLTADEFNYLAARISGHNPVKVPPTLSPYLVTMSTPRCHKPLGLLQSGSSSTDGKSKKKNSSGKKKYTKKELVLDVVSCLAVLFD